MKEIIIDKITEKNINTGLWKLDRGNKYLNAYLRNRKTPYHIVITKEIDKKFNSADWLYFDNLIKSMFNDKGRRKPKKINNQRPERSLMDFDKKLFIDSYKYNSMDPEKRGERDLNDYKKDLTEILNTFLLSKNKKEALKFFKEFVEKDWNKKRDLLAKHGKIASPMVTGGAKFPVAKNEKANTTYRKAFESYYVWRKKELNRIKKELGLNYEKPAEYGIKSGDPDAIQKLKNQIVKYENLIKDIKSGKEKGYELSLARQYLNRYKKRLESLQNIKKQGDKKITKNNITFLDNTELMRYQLFFDGIPEKEIRDELKKSGFRWSPKNKAWQSYRNNKAMILINKLLGW